MAIWVFDLDGTICSQERMGSYQYAKPYKLFIERMRRFHEAGNTIIIFTARGMNTFNGDLFEVEKHMRPLTEKWLKDNEVPYDKLILGKPVGDVYVDDKAMLPYEFTFGK
jgi:capsule biosynthesis phosphatase